jgi:hypothetical protein
MSPAVRQIYKGFFTDGLVLAAMTEDLPYLDNRVLPYDRPNLDGLSGCEFSTVYTPATRRFCAN